MVFSGLATAVNSQSEFLALRHFSIQPIARRPVSFVSVSWQPPPPGWMKVNTDGSAIGSPGLLGGGGVFRNCRGLVHGCFALSFGYGFSYEVELRAAMYAIRTAWSNGWLSLWLESDSSYVVHLLRSSSIQVPWHLAAEWVRCLHLVSCMNFRVFHIYREGNGFADRLAREGVSLSSPSWWSSIPDFCIPFSFFGLGQEVLRPCI